MVCAAGIGGALDCEGPVGLLGDVICEERRDKGHYFDGGDCEGGIVGD